MSDGPMTLAEIKETLVGEFDRGDYHDCAVVLMAAANIGTDRERLKAFCELGPEFVDKVCSNMERSRIFRSDGKVHANWAEDGGYMDFILGVMCGLGLVEQRHQAETIPESPRSEIDGTPSAPSQEKRRGRL